MLEQADDCLRARPVMAWLRRIGAKRELRSEQLAQRERAKAAGGTTEEGAARKWIHGAVHSR